MSCKNISRFQAFLTNRNGEGSTHDTTPTDDKGTRNGQIQTFRDNEGRHIHAQ